MSALAFPLRSNPASCALEIDGVTCTFPAKNRRRPYTAIKDASITIHSGEFVSVVGPTGCGKSTLLNVAAGLVRPVEGIVTVFGAPLHTINDAAGYMFQVDALLPWMSALDNVAVGLVYRGNTWRDARIVASDWLVRVGLPTHGDRYPHELSGGMRKRVALAQTLVLDPALLLMDEPFSALDVQTRHLMENELLRLWSLDRKSVIFITHDLEEAIALSDRVVLWAAGPASKEIGEFRIDLPRPRDVNEIRLTPEFVDCHRLIWAALKAEVLKGYAQSTV